MARIGRAHGIGGEVSVTLISDRSDRVTAGAEFDTDRGPLRVVSARPHGRTLLVRFDGVDGRTDAEALSGTVLRAEADDAAEGLWVHQVIGRDVVDLDGVVHGRVVAVQQNPAHDLLVLTGDVLVPAVFIVEVEEHIVVDAPDGLFP